ncbi:MAG: hypothetical protein JNG82_02975 [Opitutaceae bacterium]|nr:hypothetical protein [Opitutaceae bacterium]
MKKRRIKLSAKNPRRKATFLTLQRQHFQQLLEHSPEIRAVILAQEAERDPTRAPFPDSSAHSFPPHLPQASS